MLNVEAMRGSSALADIRRNLGCESGDLAHSTDEQPEDARVASMTPEQAFDSFCNWNGLIGWGPTLRHALDYLRASQMDSEASHV